MRRRKPDFPARVGDLPAAPGDLAIVQAFVNTADFEHRTDELSSPRALADWLAGRGLGAAAADLDAADLERAIEAREALRAVLAVPTGDEPEQELVSRLDRAATSAIVAVRFGIGARARLEAGADGLDGALGRLFGIVASEQSAGRWERLKACANPACRAAFYDASNNRSGRWCAMRRCGTRIHSRRHQRRLRRRIARRL